MNKKKLIKIGIILFTIFILGIISVGIFVTYMVNSGNTNTESNTEDNYYEQLDQLEQLEELENIDENNNETSMNSGWLKNILGFKTTYAIDVNNMVNDNKLGRELNFDNKTLKLLEKYYILSKFDTKNIPMPIFEYGRKNWNELPNVLNSFDYLNHTKHLTGFINLKIQFSNKKFYENTINTELKEIIINYFKKKQSINNVTYLPKDIADDDSFDFMIQGLKNHNYLVSNSKKLGKELDFDYHLTLAAILTEQFRYAGTYRGFVKTQLKKTPFIFSMTQFSHGVGGIKEFTGNKIYNDAKSYGYDNVFDLENSDAYKNKSRTALLQDVYWETIYPNVLIKNIIERWSISGNSITNKPGIILTLYNFGNPTNKKPHGNPKVGGAVIKLNEDENREYTFGGLGESLYYYIKVYDLY